MKLVIHCITAVCFRHSSKAKWRSQETWAWHWNSNNCNQRLASPSCRLQVSVFDSAICKSKQFLSISVCINPVVDLVCPNYFQWTAHATQASRQDVCISTGCCSPSVTVPGMSCSVMDPPKPTVCTDSLSAWSVHASLPLPSQSILKRVTRGLLAKMFLCN